MYIQIEIIWWLLHCKSLLLGPVYMEKNSPLDWEISRLGGYPSLFNFNVASTCEPRYPCKPGTRLTETLRFYHVNTWHPSYLGEVSYLELFLASNYCQAFARHIVGPVRRAGSFSCKHKISRHLPSRDISVRQAIFLYVNRALYGSK